MILTHLLVLVGLPPAAIGAQAAVLRLAATPALVSAQAGARRDLALLPALPVRAAKAVRILRQS